MTTETLKQLMELLVDLDCHIEDKSIKIEELKSLILIIYYEILTKDNPNRIIKDYLTLVTQHFIELENQIQALSEQKEINMEKEIISTFVHRKLNDYSDVEDV